MRISNVNWECMWWPSCGYGAQDPTLTRLAGDIAYSLWHFARYAGTKYHPIPSTLNRWMFRHFCRIYQFKAPTALVKILMIQTRKTTRYQALLSKHSHKSRIADMTPSGSSHQLGPYRIFLDICSGATGPFSQACLSRGKCILSFDILLNADMDLLNDMSYEQLLRLCSSGVVASQVQVLVVYSRLKLRPVLYRTVSMVYQVFQQPIY